MENDKTYLERFKKLRSTLNSEITNLFNDYPIKLSEEFSYTSLSNDDTINVFGPFDYVRPIRNGILPFQLFSGEYYISYDFVMNDKDIWIPRGFYPLNFVKYVLGCGYIDMSDVSYGIISNKHISGDIFNTFISKNPQCIVEITDEEYPAILRQLKCQYIIELDKKQKTISIVDEIRQEFVLNRPKVIRIKEDADGLYKTLFRKNALVIGMPGCGKSHELLQIVNGRPGENMLVTAFTHAATQNVRNRGILYANSSTFLSAIWNAEFSAQDYEILGKYHLVILEEYTMLPPNNMFMLMKAWKKFGFQVICFGDPDQCPAPIDDWVPYHKNPLFMEMCGHTVIEMQYKEGYSRYDKPLHSALLKFKETGKLTTWLNRSNPPPVYKHIVYTNRMRSELNEECFNRWIKEKKAEVIKIKTFNVCIGLPVMCYNGTDKSREIFKTQEWIIVNVNKEDEQIGLQRELKYVDIPWDTFCELFDYSFAITAHKCQGITIKEDFIVHETNIMTWEIAYTAISRGTALSKVHIAGPISTRCLSRASRDDSIQITKI
jgi:hypothetical protein